MAAIDRELLMTLTEALAALVQRVGAVEGVARIPGPPPTTAEIQAAAEKWLNANRDSLRGNDGDSVTPEQVQEFAVEWLAANITQPKDGDPGRDPTATEIQTAVELWLEFNRESLKGEDGADASPEMVTQAVREWLIANPIRVPKDGENASPEMVAEAVTAWLADNPIRVPKDGDDGDDGTDGVGIDRIEQPNEDTARVILTDGREYDLKLPRGKDGAIVVKGGGSQHGGGSGGGIVEIVAGEGIAVDNTDPARPIVSATGSADSRQEVFIGAPAILPTYPALIFTERTIGGQTVYEMQVNVP